MVLQKHFRNGKIFKMNKRCETFFGYQYFLVHNWTESIFDHIPAIETHVLSFLIYF
jgi:hypothetical protein